MKAQAMTDPAEPLSAEEEAVYRESLPHIPPVASEEPLSAVEYGRREWAERCRRLLATLDAARQATPATEALKPEERLDIIVGHLNALLSDGPFMDGLTAEGPWWTPADPTAVALYEAIVGFQQELTSDSSLRGKLRGPSE